MICEKVMAKTVSGEAKEYIERVDYQFCSKIQKPEVEMKECVGAPCPTPSM